MINENLLHEFYVFSAINIFACRADSAYPQRAERPVYELAPRPTKTIFINADSQVFGKAPLLSDVEASLKCLKGYS